MFEGIPFTHITTEKPLTSQCITSEVLEKSDYDPDNLSNSEFWITGSVDAFLQVPITDFVRENLLYLQSFNDSDSVSMQCG